MSNHTPGPWVVLNDDSLNDIGIASMSLYQQGNSKCRICLIPKNSDEDLCNAHLIAAAPDLLESLKDCCDEASGFTAPHCYACRIENGHCATKDVCKVWKAIQKAEGK